MKAMCRPIDLERLRLLATDDRPLSEKQTELLMVGRVIHCSMLY